MALKLLNSNTLYVDNINTSNLELEYEYYPNSNKIKSHIKRLIINDTIEYTIGMKVKINMNFGEDKFMTTFTINHLRVEYINKDRCTVFFNQEIRNQSVLYLIPMLKTKEMKDNISFSTTQQLINSYLYEDTLVLKYRYNTFILYENTINQLKQHPQLLTIQHSKDKLYDFYQFNITNTNENLYNLQIFKESKFNQFTEDYRTSIIKFNKLTPQSIDYRILNDDKLLREHMEELLDVPIPDHLPLNSKITDKEFIDYGAMGFRD